MNIWLILWFVLAFSLLVFFVWTLYILVRQKNAWKQFAERRKLRYKAGGLTGSPEMDGVISDYKVSFFTGEHVSPDGRNMRKLTAIEINLQSRMPVSGGVASGGMVSIMQSLRWKSEYVPDYKGWDKSYVVSTDSRRVMSAYLDDERLDALCGLMKRKNSWVILIFRDDAMLLRMDTFDPLCSAREINLLVQQMIQAARALELRTGESSLLKSESLKEDIKGLSLDADGHDLDGGITLELEDEEHDVATATDTDVDIEVSVPSQSSQSSKE